MSRACTAEQWGRKVNEGGVAGVWSLGDPGRGVWTDMRGPERATEVLELSCISPESKRVMLTSPYPFLARWPTQWQSGTYAHRWHSGIEVSPRH